MKASLRELDIRGDRKRFVYQTERGAALQLSYSAAHLLERRAAGADPALVAREFSEAMGRPIAVAEIEAAYTRLDNRVALAEEEEAGVPRGFAGRFRLVPASLVDRIGSRLGILFEPYIFAAVAVSALVAIAVTLRTDGIGIGLGGASFWLGYALFLGSLLVHEFGHAAAARRFGAPVGEIGATMYLIYPALYTDVTSAWRLTRAQRVTVDVGGVYFQTIVAAIVLAAGHALHFEAARAGGLLMLASCAFAMNPFLRNDGYWVLSDALGVANFGRAALRSLRAGQGGAFRGPVLVVLIAYGAGSLLVGAAIVCAVVLSVVHIVPIVPALVVALGHDLFAAHRVPAPRELNALLQLAFPVLFISSLLLRRRRGGASAMHAGKP